MEGAGVCQAHLQLLLFLLIPHKKGEWRGIYFVLWIFSRIFGLFLCENLSVR